MSQRARAYTGFTRQILNGGILPGQFISQRELMTLLDMPLGAVREMIPRLEAGGLIKTVPKRGLQIAHVDLKLIRNAFQVRTMIEREAVLNFVHTATDSELEAIEASHRDILARASAINADVNADVFLLDDASSLKGHAWQVCIRAYDRALQEVKRTVFDGQGAVTFLVKVKEHIEDPQRFLLDI